MRTLKLNQQLFMSFGIPALLAIVAAFVALNALNTSNKLFRDYMIDHRHVIDLAGEVRAAVNERAIAARNMVLTQSLPDRAQLHKQVVTAHEHMTRALASLHEALGQDHNATSTDREYVLKISEVEKRYGPVALAITALAAEGRQQEAIDMMNAECRPLLKKLLTVVADYLAYADEAAVSMVSEASTAATDRRLLTIGISALVVASAIVFGMLLLRSVSNALGAEPSCIREIIGRIAEGNLGAITQAENAREGSVLASMSLMQNGW